HDTGSRRRRAAADPAGSALRLRDLSPAPVDGMSRHRIRIGTAEATAGRIVRGTMALGEYPDGAPITSAVTIAQGARAGATLWVQGCVHGPEVGGIVGMVAFLRKLDIAALSGTVICLSTANPLGFRAYQRLTPQDGVNLNRAFPGEPAGGSSAQ